MLCYSIPALWEAIGRNRKHLLISTAALFVPFYGFYFHMQDLIHLPWDFDTIEIAFDVTAIFLSWGTVITIIAYGQHYLNRPHPWLSKINEGLYPFYILHQTVIIFIGYYICQFDWSIAAKFWAVSMLTIKVANLVVLFIIALIIIIVHNDVVVSATCVVMFLFLFVIVIMIVSVIVIVIVIVASVIISVGTICFSCRQRMCISLR